MALYAIGDLHLAQSVNKPMDVFGPGWSNHAQRLEAAFSQLGEGDVTVLCGDISWGIDFSESLADFQFIDRLPGKKIIVKGNHDYWWNTAAKMRRFFQENGLESLEILHNNAYFYEDWALCGTRGWFYEEEASGHNEKVLNREVGRLEASLRAAGGRPILAFLHYPPLYTGYRCPEVVSKLEEYRVQRCFYGHLHGPTHKRAVEGTVGNVAYSLVSADYLGFTPKKILD
ncbi:MAG: serine/threonine protein phosphatase [Oscillospiraceae bacterium]|jgi:predicted phosphohydrolase|nr:serine/threonine protein phosphatase [Oscillospiraceae bacterium]